ncbi:MAG: Gfo/Idh/MocA family oxidoreductase, partial [Ruthenibacterium sp.]
MWNAAIIGCGAIYQNHANALVRMENTALCAVCDIDEAAAQRAATQYHCSYYTNYRALLADPKVDTVHICTPHYLHCEMAIAAMRAGKDVLTEKPICLHPLDAQQMQQVALETGRRLGVCFQNRYNETAQQAKLLLSGGALGKVLGAKSMFTWNRDEAYYNQAAWRGTWAQEGGGVLINQAIHTLDMLQWLLGEIQSISANVATRRLYDTIEVEDTADAFIRFKSGAECVFFASNCYAVTSRVEIEIVTELGVLSLSDNELFWQQNGKERQSLRQAASATGEKSCWGLGHETLIRDFYAKRAADEPFPVDA